MDSQRHEAEEKVVANLQSSDAVGTVETVLARHRALLTAGLRETLAAARQATLPAPATAALLETFHRQIEYHLGWRQADLSAVTTYPGKLLRPTLVLLAAELAAGRAGAGPEQRQAAARRAVPAGVCVELIHNFSLIHDDIEDGDEERRYRPTLWKLWGVPQAINLGDGLFSMARFGLWQLAERGVPATAIVRLAAVVDRTCLELCEGQYLDMTFEGRADVTAAMYLDMIGRKTAALMASSTELGARIGDADERTGALMAEFGRALGMAFQLRDDVLGIWAASELGKSAAGDLRRRKMSLPIIHARENAAARDRRTLTRLFAQPQEPSDALLAEALTILEQTGARERATEALREQVALARRALDQAAADAAAAAEAHALLAALLSFVAEVAA